MLRNRAKVRQSPSIPLPLIAPGFLGLNTERGTTAGFESPLWALDLQNAVFDEAGIPLSLRKGWVRKTDTAMTGAPEVYRVHEYLRSSGATELVAATYGDEGVIQFWYSVDDGETWSEITGDVVTATPLWNFVTFGDIVYAAAPGQQLHFFDGSGDLEPVPDSPVCNGAIVAAFGRIWVGVDGTSQVGYSGIGNGLDWTGITAGFLDLDLVWTQGIDKIRALAAFGATFVVFGTRHIILYVDGTGSVLGIDPTSMYVVDTIEGTGAIGQQSIVSIGEGDLWFLSPQGVQSLGRVVQEKVNPLVGVTDEIRTYVKKLTLEQSYGIGDVQAIYSPLDQFCLFMFPDEGVILCIDTKMAQQGIFRISDWRVASLRSICLRLDGRIFFGTNDGEVAAYEGYLDDGEDYSLVYSSPWLAGDEQLINKLKMIKQVYALVYGREGISLVCRIGYNYLPFRYEETLVNEFLSEGGEYGIGEYGLDEYGTGHRMRRQYMAGMGDGFVFQVQLVAQNDDVAARIGLQEIGVHVKIGRNV